jgi:hypothetical protein
MMWERCVELGENGDYRVLQLIARMCTLTCSALPARGLLHATLLV